MNLDRFAKLVSRAVDKLPADIHPYLENVAIDVERRPSRKTLREQGFTDEEIAAGESLYGLFIPHFAADGGEVWEGLDRIVVYMQPLVEDFPDPAELRLEVRKTVVHEIAHHFGLSESDLDRFEATRDPFGDES